jgi:ubiquinone/menaquinone biosynthesis C-methylase UbiE
MSLWEAIGAQLAHPRGVAGTALGQAMRFVNDRPNGLAIEALEIEPDDSILELGFGPGGALARLAALAPRGTVHGIDWSPAMHKLAVGRNRQALTEGRLILHSGTFTVLPFGGAQFDKLLAVNVAYFWADPAAALREGRRVLKNGGRLALYVTHAETMRRWKFASSATHRTFGNEELRTVLCEAGFRAEEVSVREMEIGLGIRGILASAIKT